MKFNKLYNNCYFLEINNNVILISYESIIGIIKNDILYLNEHYLNYSKTTTKHINLFRKNLCFENEIISNENNFLKLFSF